MEIVTLRHQPEHVQRSRAELLSASEIIDTSNDVLAAAGLLMETPAHPPPSMEMNTVALKLPALLYGRTIRENGSCMRGEISNTQSRPLNGHPPSDILNKAIMYGTCDFVTLFFHRNKPLMSWRTLMAYSVLSHNSEESFNKLLSPRPVPNSDHLQRRPSHGDNTYQGSK